MKCGSVGTRPSGSCSPTGGPIRSPALVTTTRSARIGASVGLFRPCSGVVTVSASNPQPRRRPIKAVISEQTPQRSSRPGGAVAFLDLALVHGPEMVPQTPQRSSRPGGAVAFLDLALVHGPEMVPQTPQRSSRPGR